MKEELTKERALELHRKMWGDMQRDLGDCPSSLERIKYKENWCNCNGYAWILNDCFLCEYAEKYNLPCDDCPIDWSSLSDEPNNYTCMAYYGDGFVQSNAPISEILALPERSFEDDRK